MQNVSLTEEKIVRILVGARSRDIYIMYQMVAYYFNIHLACVGEFGIRLRVPYATT